ncbi:MAG: biotin--[Treponema sp.]|nr:biotin--[acetyl-CoA-carboxylase] ligase [Treponema sp.]
MKVKDIVLQVLQQALHDERHVDGYVSGEELAELCHVSRVSVWKAVKALRAKGFAIDAVTNKGYKFMHSDICTKDSILSFMPECHDVSIRFYDSIDSTNTEAKRLLLQEDKNVLHKTVLVALQQSAGKGRFGRHFYSPAVTGIYFSIIYIPRHYMHPGFVTAAAAVGLCRSIYSVYGVHCGIKWTNDIIHKGKKVAGILTEGIASFETGSIDSIIIGCGINIIPNSSLPIDLKDSVGCICLKNADAKRSMLCASAIQEIYAILDGDDEYKKEAMKEYKSRSVLIGKQITVYPLPGGTEKCCEGTRAYTCRVLDVLDNGVLSVQNENGDVIQLQSGEVSLHG